MRNEYQPFQRAGLMLGLLAFDAALWIGIVVGGYLIVSALR
jgi:hypothetical protein